MTTTAGTASPQAWELWWAQAEDERQTSQILFDRGRWAASCFHALQCIEMALKTLARKETTWDDTDRASQTWDEVDRDNLKWNQHDVGGEEIQKHSPIKLLDSLHVWHRKPLERFREQFKQIHTDNWYEATRYPEDRWGKKWNASFSENEAVELQTLTAEILTVVGECLSIVPSTSE